MKTRPQFARPLFLNLLAAMFFVLALGFPLRLWLMSSAHFESLGLFYQNSLFSLTLSLCFLLQIPLLLRASRLLSVSLPLNLLALILFNLHTLETPLSINWEAGLVALCLVPSFPHLFGYIRNPKTRKWLQQTRYSAQKRVRLKGPWQNFGDIYTYDVSASGLFLCFPQNGPMPEDFTENQKLDFQLQLDDSQTVELRAKVVRIAPQVGKHPAGLGVVLLKASRESRKIYEKFIQREKLYQQMGLLFLN